MRAFLGFGSNLGDREAYIRDAVRQVPDLLRVSPLYESYAEGGPPGQGPFLNCVAEMDTSLTPRMLLKWCQGREMLANRKRDVRWGPRTLDVDVLLYGELEVREPDLEIPHPRMWARPFVIAPLADLDPKLIKYGVEQWARPKVRLVGELDLGRNA
jgi:2-amino-4-hydroxy-6-hydroxymethyldihydropteridine diphosphokinase